MNKIKKSDFIQNGKFTNLGMLVLVFTVVSVTNKVLHEIVEFEEVDNNEQFKERK